MIIWTRLLKSACSLLLMAVLCAAFSGNWLHPNLAWSEVVLVKKSSAGPTVYLSSLTSNQFLSPEQQDALKSSFATKLLAQGVIVVMEKPSQDIFDEVSVSLIIRDLSPRPPIVPARYVCDVMGMIIRHGTEGTRKRELQRHNAATSGSASSAIRTCLQPAAATVRKGIDAINLPPSKKHRQ